MLPECKKKQPRCYVLLHFCCPHCVTHDGRVRSLELLGNQWLNNGREFPSGASNNGASRSLGLWSGCTRCFALIVRTGSSLWWKQEVDHLANGPSVGMGHSFLQQCRCLQSEPILFPGAALFFPNVSLWPDFSQSVRRRGGGGGGSRTLHGVPHFAVHRVRALLHRS